MTIRRQGAPAELEVAGVVARPRRLGLDALHQMSEAASREPVRGSRVVGVDAVLAAAGGAEGGNFVTFASGDGVYRASVPLADATEKGLLLIGPDATGLDVAAGGPIRLIVPEGDTLCWNVKNVVMLDVTIEKEPDSVPENPTH